MTLVSLVVTGLLQAGEPCEAPRVRDTAPLLAAIAQDKVMAQTFVKAAGACVEPGEACTAARLECGTLLTSTIQKQVAFDEGVWLRDMLLPYLGSSYPMTRTFGAAQLATDASCNVEVAVLQSAGQKRSTQAIRRDSLVAEYALYAKWAQNQFQQCKERMSASDAQNAAARAEAERLAAQNSAIAAAAAAKAAEEKKAREAAEAEARRQQEAKDAAIAEAKKREQAERDAKDQAAREKREAEERAAKAEEQRRQDAKDAEAARKQEAKEAEEQRQKEKEAEEKKIAQEREAAEQKAREEAEQKLVSARDTRTAQLREQKARMVKEAQEALDHAKANEALKKQAAVDAVASSPAIAQAAVAEAADAEKARVAAEKHLFDAQQKADAIVIDDSYERGGGSLFVNGGGSGVDGGFGLGVLAGAHLGFWGTAPSEGMASGFELRLWARFLGQVSGTGHSGLDLLLTGRYYFGRISLGVAGELRLQEPNLSTVRAGVGPAIAAALVDNHETRVVVGLNYIPVGNTIDVLRFVGDFEVGYKFFSLHVLGGSAARTLADGSTTTGWQVGGYLGVRFGW